VRLARYSYNLQRMRSRTEYYQADGVTRVSYTDYAYDVQNRLTSIWHKKDNDATIERSEQNPAFSFSSKPLLAFCKERSVWT